MNAHSQADDPALMYVMQFNAGEHTYQETHLRKQQAERVQDPLDGEKKAIDTVLAQWGR